MGFAAAGILPLGSTGPMGKATLPYPTAATPPARLSAIPARPPPAHRRQPPVTTLRATPSPLREQHDHVPFELLVDTTAETVPTARQTAASTMLERHPMLDNAR